MSYSRSKFHIFGIIFFLLFISTTTLYANIRISGGLSREYTLSPAEVFDDELIIYNSSDVAVDVKIYLSDYFYTWDGRTRYLQAGTEERSNADWLELRDGEIYTIPANDSFSFKYSIEVPADEELIGTYWSMIMVEPQSGLNFFD